LFERFLTSRNETYLGRRPSFIFFGCDCARRDAVRVRDGDVVRAANRGGFPFSLSEKKMV
jgi:hypothetical protein